MPPKSEKGLRYLKALSYPFIKDSIYKKKTIQDIKAAVRCAGGNIAEITRILENNYMNWANSDYIAVSFEGRSNQDRFVVGNIIGKEMIRVYAVMDGHAGFKAVNIVRSILMNYLSDIIQIDFNNSSQVEIFLKMMYLEIDKLLLKKRVTDGTTLVIALIGQKSIYISSVGDSKGCLFDKHGKILISTIPHKPSLPEEKERIQSFGGEIYFPKVVPRVEGGLAMSRALGDFKYKISPKKLAQVKKEHPDSENGVSTYLGIPKSNNVYHNGMVSCEPDVFYYPRDGTEKGIFLASDGVIDVLDDREVVNILLENGKKGALKILNSSITQTTDDVTIVYIDLAYGHPNYDKRYVFNESTKTKSGETVFDNFNL